MTEASMTDVLVAIGRIEEMIKAMNAKLDTLESQTERKFALIDEQSDRLWKQIASLRTDLELVKETMPRRAPWWAWAAVVAALAQFILGVLDRIFVNQ